LRYFDEGFVHGPSPVDLGSAGYAAGQLGDYEKAFWYYSEAIRFDAPGAAPNYRGRAWAMSKLGRSDLAAGDLRAAAAIGGQDTDSLRAKAEAFVDVRQYAEAEKALLAALNLDANDEGSLEAIAELYLWHLKQPAKAKSSVAKLEELYPTKARSWALSAELANGVDAAKQAYALKRYLAVVDDNEPTEKACIERSKKQLLALQKKQTPEPR
jgi:tetratricopeptide (TPR) repeat protein